MRNIIEYPVTKEEVMIVLKDVQKEILDDESIGDIRPLILETIHSFLIEKSDDLEEFLHERKGNI